MSAQSKSTKATLTAYALGELPVDRVTAVEAFLATNPDAREQVATIRAATATADLRRHEARARRRR